MNRSVGVLYVCVVALAVACGGKSKPATEPAPVAKPAEPAAPPRKETVVLDRLAEATEEMCACKDAACAEASQARMGEWIDAHTADFEDFKPTPEEDKRGRELSDRLDACRDKWAPAETAAPDGEPVTNASVIASFGGFGDRVCACKDKACVEKVQADLMDWAMKHMEQFNQLKPTPDDEKAMEAIQVKMSDCAKRFQTP